MKDGNPVHGHCPRSGFSPTYISYVGMKQRCLYKKGQKYKRYGGAGVTLCDRWMKFENFLADMGERPPGKTIDRIKNEIGYEPGNCRWATPKEQADNRRPPKEGNIAKTHCPSGHEYSGANLRICKTPASSGSGIGRKCKTCERERAQRVRDAAKGK